MVFLRTISLAESWGGRRYLRNHSYFFISIKRPWMILSGLQGQCLIFPNLINIWEQLAFIQGYVCPNFLSYSTFKQKTQLRTYHLLYLPSQKQWIQRLLALPRRQGKPFNWLLQGTNHQTWCAQLVSSLYSKATVSRLC